MWITLLLLLILGCSSVSSKSIDATYVSLDDSFASPSSTSLVEPPPPIEPPTQNCPLNCSGNGDCNTAESRCYCNPSWAGSGCQYFINPINLDVLTNGTLSRTATSPSLAWNYYKGTISSGNVLKAIITPTECTLNLYASYNSAPTIEVYQSAVQAQTKEVLRIDAPPIGDWVFGLASTNNCSYSLQIKTLWTCPNDCNDHGTCNDQTGTCDCNPGYTILADCSQALFPASSEIQMGTVSALSWIYYTYDSSNNSMTLRFTVTAAQSQENVGEAPSQYDDGAFAITANAYLRHGNLPTIFDYDNSCTKVPLNHNCTIHITKPKPGQWNLGLWSASNFNYTIQFSGSMLCPNDCQGYGTCNLNDGICQCLPFYNHPDCGLYNRPLTPNSPPTEPISINSQQTQYFTYQETEDINDMTFIVNQTGSPNSDLLVMASCGHMPTLYTYDHAIICESGSIGCMLKVINGSTTCSWTFAISQIAIPQGSSSFESLHGLSLDHNSFLPRDYNTELSYAMSNTASSAAIQVQYQVQLLAEISCPNACSDRGTCQPNGKCICPSDWNTQPDCSIFIHQMPNYISTPSSVTPGTWRYYSLFTNMATFLSFTINNLQGGKIDAYLGNNQIPNELRYYKSIMRGNQTMYQLSATSSSIQINGTWTLGIYGDDTIPTTFDLTAYSDRECPLNCSLNGKCNPNGVCVCNPGYVTSDCGSLSVALPANLEVRGSVRFDTWSYYNLTVLGDDALEIIVQENDNLIVGLVWVFLAKNRVPTHDNFDYANQTDNTIFHTILIPSGETRGIWVIGVTGSPRATGSSYLRQAKYNLLALSGCGTYTSCNTCVLDPNCGWCRNQPFDPDAGRCVPGNEQNSLNQTCSFYQYSTCGLGNDMNSALTKGLVIGVGVGLTILIAGAVSAFLVYRYWKHLEKTGLRPVHIYPEEPIRFGTVSPSPSMTGNHSTRPSTPNLTSSLAPSSPSSVLPNSLLADLDLPVPLDNDAKAATPTTSKNVVSAASSFSPSATSSSTTYTAPKPAATAATIANYGTVSNPTDKEAAPESTGEVGVYYSFTATSAYTDSESDGEDYSSDSEPEY